jgi:hypothetical protein
LGEQRRSRPSSDAHVHRALPRIRFGLARNAKIVEEHPAVADLELIDRCVRHPDKRRPDPRPARERFFRQEPDGWALAVLDFAESPAIIVTVFLADKPPA